MQTINMDTSGTIFSKSHQLLGIADDIHITKINLVAVKDFESLENKTPVFGLEVSKS